jgi:glycosyltransferase involved in cell wall biosynthesis
MQVHQLVVSAHPGDAITNAALELRAQLRHFGPSEIFACYVHPDLADEVPLLREYPRWSSRRPSRDVLVFHASIGEPQLFSFLRGRYERLVVSYHNISPSAAFLDYDPYLAAHLVAGRAEVAALAGRTELALAPSRFNAAELATMGFADVRVVPLPVDLSRLHQAVAPAAVEARLRDEVPGQLVLFVGQLLPHKRPELLIEALHILLTHIGADASLALVGAARMPRFTKALRTLVAELHLAGRVFFAGFVDEAELAAWYRRADVFVTASDHEGVCVPLLEAMSFDVPVIARACAAVPETLGGAGLLIPEAEPLTLLAEAAGMVLDDDDLASALAATGRRRLTAFDPVRARASFLDALIDLAAS